jgi:hypothetical protein
MLAFLTLFAPSPLLPQDLSEGASSIVVGAISGSGGRPLVIAGGNCSVQARAC